MWIFLIPRYNPRCMLQLHPYGAHYQLDFRVEKISLFFPSYHLINLEVLLHMHNPRKCVYHRSCYPVNREATDTPANTYVSSCIS